MSAVWALNGPYRIALAQDPDSLRPEARRAAEAAGAQPLEVFVRLIEDELARTAGPPTGPKREGLQGKTTPAPR